MLATRAVPDGYGFRVTGTKAWITHAGHADFYNLFVRTGAAAARRDSGLPATAQAAMAKLFCTDAAMRVTTDAVEVLGEAGYTRDYAAERYPREAKVPHIFEGTNQIQRLVIDRQLRAAHPRPESVTS